MDLTYVALNAACSKRLSDRLPFGKKGDYRISVVTREAVALDEFDPFVALR
jgi:hypothetical protein